jgi:hypothetical protein
LNILGFVLLPEKVLDKYFEIKGVLNLITYSMDFFWEGWGGRTFVRFFWITFVNYRAQKLNKYSLTRKYLLQKQNIINRSATCIMYNNNVV